MNLVLVADRACVHPANGGDLRIWNLLRGDADHIYLAPEVHAAVADARGEMAWRSKQHIAVDARAFRLQASDAAQNVAARNAAALAALREQLSKLTRQRGALTLIAHGHRAGFLLGWGLGKAFAFDGGDCASLFHRRRAAMLGWRHPLKALNSRAWARAFTRMEGELAAKSPLFLLPSEADAEAVRAHSPRARIVVLPNGTAQLANAVARPSEDATIGFLGGMTWEPNVAAAVYLAREVLPFVRRDVPSARLRIAGGPMVANLRDASELPGVDCVGHVSDVRDFLSTCAVFAAPMLHGAGVKNKIIEAMALGMPVITNELGAEALSARSRDAIVVAEGARALASAISALLRDPARRSELSRRARAAAEAEFRWDDIAAKMRTALESVPREDLA